MEDRLKAGLFLRRAAKDRCEPSADPPRVFVALSGNLYKQFVSRNALPNVDVITIGP
jgi:hypothetical protein